jgi:hypothetical protein
MTRPHEPDDAEPDDAEPGDAEPGDAEPGEAEPDDAEPDDAEPGDAEPGDAEPGEAEPGDADPDDAEPGDVPDGEPPLDRIAVGARHMARSAVRPIQRAVRIRADRRLSAGTTISGGYTRIYHHHVRKTGGTSLNRAFLGLGGEDPAAVHWRMRGAIHATRSGGRVYVAHDRRLVEAGHYFFGWQHAPAWSVDLPPGTFTVTVLRDPVARLISLYRYLADPRSDATQPFGAGRAERRLASAGFSRFLDHLPREAALRQLYTFSPSFSVEEAAEGVRACSAWFSTEDYQAGLPELGAVLGVALAARRDRRSVGHDVDFCAQADRLSELLAPEYRLMELLRRDPGRRLGSPERSVEELPSVRRTAGTVSD